MSRNRKRGLLSLKKYRKEVEISVLLILFSFCLIKKLIGGRKVGRRGDSRKEKSAKVVRKVISLL